MWLSNQFIGFRGEASCTLGYVNVHLAFGSIWIATRFDIINTHTSYHLPLKRPLRNKHHVMSSSYYQYLKEIWREKKVHPKPPRCHSRRTRHIFFRLVSLTSLQKMGRLCQLVLKVYHYQNGRRPMCKYWRIPVIKPLLLPILHNHRRRKSSEKKRARQEEKLRDVRKLVDRRISYILWWPEALDHSLGSGPQEHECLEADEVMLIV